MEYSVAQLQSQLGRLISFTVSLPSSTPADKAREILKSMIVNDPRILKDPSPAVFVES